MSKTKEKVEFKPKFIEHYSKLTNWEEFSTCSLTFLRRSIRVNTLKMDINTLKNRLIKQGWILTQIPWCEEGFWVEHETGRRDIGNVIEHTLGYFYVQESASMIPPVVLKPQPGEIILDMCASPGSKTTQIAQYMKNKGILVSNDYKGMRLAPLGINSQRMGITNQIISLSEGQTIGNIQFDRILVDAPCSGTGTIRKSLKTLRIWNTNMVKRLSITQKNLLENAYHLLKPGGTMVYSTCSLEPWEDEAVIDFIISKYHDLSVESFELPLKRGTPITEFEGFKYSDEVKKCLRIWPQDNDTEGFFVTKLKKN